MTKALTWIRQSKGEDDSASLEMQREKLPELAEEHADQFDELDLGVHTGFSIHEKDPGQKRIDDNEEVLEKISQIRNGEYDYLVAWDDTRICRDEYFHAIERACIEGNCEMIFKGDVERDNLAFGVKRQVEKHVKQEEIKKAKKALKRKKEKGEPLGEPPKGLKYSKDKKELVPDPEDFDQVIQAIKMREEENATLEEIEEKTGIPTSTASRIINERKEEYLEKKKP